MSRYHVRMIYTSMCLRVRPHCVDIPRASEASASKLFRTGKPSWRPACCHQTLHGPASLPCRCRQAGRQRWILPCGNHPLSMAPRQNPPTHLLFQFLTLFPRVPLLLLRQHEWGRGRSAGALESKDTLPQNGSGSVLQVYMVPYILHIGSDIQSTPQYSSILEL